MCNHMLAAKLRSGRAEQGAWWPGAAAPVYLCTWENVAAQRAGSQPPIPDGQPVAIKIMSLPKQATNLKPFEEMTARHQFRAAGIYLERQLRIEVNILGALHHQYPQGSCGARVVHPLGIVRWGGEWHEAAEQRQQGGWQPLYGFCMPYYELGAQGELLESAAVHTLLIKDTPTHAHPNTVGSLATLLRTVCIGNADPGVVSRLLSYRNLSNELVTLARELRKIHTIPCGGKGLQLQDLTANNLLKLNSVGTWLWGSSRARNQQFDPKADLYSLCYCFADMWMVAEGAPMLPSDTVVTMDLDADRGLQFMRTLMVECLKLEHNGSRIVRRTQRHTPVAWLGAWAILLGFRDYKELKHWKEDGLPCLRPSEEQMLPAFELWAHVVALAAEVPAELTAEQACSPACAELVGSMTEMLGSLVSLSHLDDAGPQQDANLAWLAANFMAQDHPLVAAMRAQGAVGVGTPAAITPMYDGETGWGDVMQFAKRAVAPSGLPRPKAVAAAAAAPAAVAAAPVPKEDTREQMMRALVEMAQVCSRERCDSTCF
ncbi:hypothetical protein COHA_001290 [Chlorella ohadii]|uniref:Uncharacterized protein n=1 Tax=Chlorella ohadii TaxID=2649997 RepID=A0AAD5DZ83_9CHLO|nr:hypothetical protein COHA_001290 [Chlorella ohadii]